MLPKSTKKIVTVKMISVNVLVWERLSVSSFVGVTPTIFQPVYPTVFTITERSTPLKVSIWLPSS